MTHSVPTVSFAPRFLLLLSLNDLVGELNYLLTDMTFHFAPCFGVVQTGQRFTVREGNKTVGTGVVTKILE